MKVVDMLLNKETKLYMYIMKNYKDLFLFNFSYGQKEKLNKIPDSEK